LWEDGERIFCRHTGDVNADRSTVLAVLPAVDHPTPAILDGLAHEYALKDELDEAWAVRPLELIQESGRTILVLEDPGGEPLDGLLSVPLDLERFLRLSIGIAGAVGKVHQRDLIHKDIKPANILVESATARAWLTGFGIASRLPRERQAPDPPETLAGSLAYMAPEQTGRMNRSIDSRSDLYSLGVTLYQMLTGALPFTAADPMEWVHCHIARRPIAPADRLKDVPSAVSAIIMKLLAKTAEDRYQTAGGVEHDLRQCLDGWEARRHIDGFPLGQRDTPDRLLVPEKLYGRAREVGTLLASFDRVVKGEVPELVLVSGYSGIGKSSVVNELHKVLVPPRGLFASGKFDQYKRDIPYSTLAQAFQSLVRPLLGKSDTELSHWRDAFLEALGPNGKLMDDVVPELKLIIGVQPTVPELPPQDAQRRFQLVFRRFIGVFARPEHPLALFLDDLQWLDTATLDLLEDLLTRSDLQHLMLIGAYRDNEVTSAHPLTRTLDAIKSAGGRVEEVTLAPLAQEHLGQLMADALRCEPERAAPLAQLVHEKTAGNPFFAIQFISSLAKEGMLAFDHEVARWFWDLDRIHAKGYTDNVVDLMAGKLIRLPAETRKAMQRLACLGNIAEITRLSIVLETSEEQLHTVLWPAVHQEFVERLKSAYKFLHDRIQQAAYSLVPEEHRAEIHCRIGRVLLANMTADEVTEHLFDVAHQLNRGAGLLIDRNEKAQAATINLRAGRKAKASAAYASASLYFAAGIALLTENEWSSRHDLMFSLRLEYAECRFLTYDFDAAEQLIAELLRRGTSNIDLEAVHHLQIQLYEMKGEYGRAIESARTCLRLFGVDMPANPTWEQVKSEYEAVWRNLHGRPIEALIDLPLMTDPEMCAEMEILSIVLPSAYFSDFRLYYLLVFRMANVSMRHGMSGAAAHAYGWLGSFLGAVFHRYSEAYRFTRLAYDLVERYDFVAYRAKVQFTMGAVSLWTQPIATAMDFNRMCFHSATENGDLIFACYAMMQSITNLLLRNDALDVVWRESEHALDFVEKAGFQDMADLIVSHQRFIKVLQGRTATFSTFSDVQFDEPAFEATLTTGRMTMLICWYWISKLKARFMSGNYGEALAAADKAKSLLWATNGHMQSLEYFYYTALAVAAVYENGRADEQTAWRELLSAHQEQLREWSENHPATFADKHVLVLAEVARIEVRDLEAMRLYEEAIRVARKHSFIQHEGLGNELAARFYAARGFEKIALTYLRDARRCYVSWGADGKVRQLDEMYPYLREEAPAPGLTSTIGAPVEHLDLATVLNVSQAVSGEIVLEKLVDTLMRTAIEQAGAERGLLILPRGAEQRIKAEATTTGDAITVNLRDEAVTPAMLPESVLHYVLRMRDSVIVDNAAAQAPFAADPYVRQREARSVLCLPLVTQARLIGVLYLENNLASRVFATRRTAVLKLLASQAAISLENIRLYREVAEREAKIRRLVDGNVIGIFIFNREGDIVDANQAFLNMVGYDQEDLVAGRVRWTELTPPEWRDRTARARTEIDLTGTIQPFEKEYFHKDGSRVPVLIGSAAFDEQRDQGVAFVLDLTERKRAETEARQSDQRYREIQMELAHANRVATMGLLTASIAHEVNQPITAAVTDALAALRWLRTQPPNFDEVAESLARIVSEGNRAGEVIKRIRALIKKAPPRKDAIAINDAITEVIALTRAEAAKNGVSVRTQLTEGLPFVQGDRVQLQQVVLNLALNAIEAMSTVTGNERQLSISTKNEPDGLLVEVQDSGPGLASASPDLLFEAFYTTKPGGLGLGLSICRSIIEAHGGRLWASANISSGAIFHFTVPAHPEGASCRGADRVDDAADARSSR
jgi:PAS domain S-box-containing protein